ncbi:MAG TPA: hypothetical protein VEI50_02530 [Nitrospiraceae bacterium]|nr:hypothetical protein [Nitrospiraceae bacterium]
MIAVVGGDSVETIKQHAGAAKIVHWSGRRARDVQRTLPQDTEVVVVILDRISHGLSRKIRAEARRRGLPILFKTRKTTRSTMSLDSRRAF